MKQIGNKLFELLPEEIAQMEEEAQQAEHEYWLNTPYDDLVNNEVRKEYSESQEFAVLRQKDEKPEEYLQYFNYCEQCKQFVKNKLMEVTK